MIDDALVTGQKMLSCVLGVNERLGADYGTKVLTGSRDKRILGGGHDRLSTCGILSEYRRHDVQPWVDQFVNHGFLPKDGEYHVVNVTKKDRRLLKGNLLSTLLQSVKSRTVQTPTLVLDSWEAWTWDYSKNFEPCAAPTPEPLRPTSCLVT